MSSTSSGRPLRPRRTLGGTIMLKASMVFIFLLGRLDGEAVVQECPRRRDIDGKVFRRHQREIAQIRPEEAWIALLTRVDIIEARELGSAMGGQIIGHQPPAATHSASYRTLT